MRSIKAIFYKALGAWVLGSLYGMPSWRDRIEERRRRFQQLMLQAEHGDSAASRELENEIWQNFVNDHGTPEQQAAYATRADAREFYAYTETLHDYYATYHNKRASDIKRLEALKEIFVIVTKIFSRANQRRFRQQFGESPADIRRSMVVFFQAACEVRRKAAPGVRRHHHSSERLAGSPATSLSLAHRGWP